MNMASIHLEFICGPMGLLLSATLLFSLFTERADKIRANLPLFRIFARLHLSLAVLVLADAKEKHLVVECFINKYARIVLQQEVEDFVEILQHCNLH